MPDSVVRLRFKGPYVPEKKNHGFVRVLAEVDYLNNAAYMAAVKRGIALPKLQELYSELDPPVHLEVADIELIPDFRKS